MKKEPYADIDKLIPPKGYEPGRDHPEPVLRERQLPPISHKRKAAQIYDEYWSQVNKLPVKNTDPLPDIRPLIERALIEAENSARADERQACADIIHTEYLAYTEGGFSASQCFVDAEKKIRAGGRENK